MSEEKKKKSTIMSLFRKEPDEDYKDKSESNVLTEKKPEASDFSLSESLKKDLDSLDKTPTDEDESLSEEEKRKYKIVSFVSYILIALIALAVFGGVFYITRPLNLGNNNTESTTTSSGEETVRVPDIIGLDESDAVKTLQSTQLGLKQVSSIVSEEPMGTVLEQTPEAGEYVPLHTTIQVVESEGPVEVRMPNLEGINISEAYEKLNTAHITKIKTNKTYESGLPFGSIISSEPGYDHVIKDAEEVVINISAGSAKTNATPSRYIGMKSKDAVDAAVNDRLIPVVEYGYSDNVDEGFVFMQSVDKGAPVMAGAEIILTVSKGAASEQIQDATMYQAKIDFPVSVTGNKYKILALEKTDLDIFEIKIDESDTPPQFPYKVDVPLAQGVKECKLWYYEENKDKIYVPRATWTILNDEKGPEEKPEKEAETPEATEKNETEETENTSSKS